MLVSLVFRVGSLCSASGPNARTYHYHDVDRSIMLRGVQLAVEARHKARSANRSVSSPQAILCPAHFQSDTLQSHGHTDSLGNGYGFPSSHSQYMGYFASFLMCHLYFRHRFTSCGYPILDRAWRVLLYVGIGGWAVVVAYSRFVCFTILCCSSV
jgi:membrane-associated phospholipid phosphatase